MVYLTWQGRTPTMNERHWKLQRLSGRAFLTPPHSPAGYETQTQGPREYALKPFPGETARKLGMSITYVYLIVGLEE